MKLHRAFLPRSPRPRIPELSATPRPYNCAKPPIQRQSNATNHCFVPHSYQLIAKSRKAILRSQSHSDRAVKDMSMNVEGSVLQYDCEIRKGPKEGYVKIKKRRLAYEETKSKLHQPLKQNIAKHTKGKDIRDSKDSLNACAPTELNSSTPRYSNSLLSYFQLQVQQRYDRIATYQQEINNLDTERGERCEEEKSFNTVLCTQPREDASSGKHSQANMRQSPYKKAVSQAKSVQLRASCDSIANKPYAGNKICTIVGKRKETRRVCLTF